MGQGRVSSIALAVVFVVLAGGICLAVDHSVKTRSHEIAAQISNLGAKKSAPGLYMINNTELKVSGRNLTIVRDGVSIVIRNVTDLMIFVLCRYEDHATIDLGGLCDIKIAPASCLTPDKIVVWIKMQDSRMVIKDLGRPVEYKNTKQYLDSLEDWLNSDRIPLAIETPAEATTK